VDLDPKVYGLVELPPTTVPDADPMLESSDYSERLLTKDLCVLDDDDPITKNMERSLIVFKTGTGHRLGHLSTRTSTQNWIDLVRSDFNDSVQ
jgi:hypothetical protein